MANRWKTLEGMQNAAGSIGGALAHLGELRRQSVFDARRMEQMDLDKKTKQQAIDREAQEAPFRAQKMADEADAYKAKNGMIEGEGEIAKRMRTERGYRVPQGMKSLSGQDASGARADARTNDYIAQPQQIQTQHKWVTPAGQMAPRGDELSVGGKSVVPMSGARYEELDRMPANMRSDATNAMQLLPVSQSSKDRSIGGGPQMASTEEQQASLGKQFAPSEEMYKFSKGVEANKRKIGLEDTANAQKAQRYEDMKNRLNRTDATAKDRISQSQMSTEQRALSSSLDSLKDLAYMRFREDPEDPEIPAILQKIQPLQEALNRMGGIQPPAAPAQPQAVAPTRPAPADHGPMLRAAIGAAKTPDEGIQQFVLAFTQNGFPLSDGDLGNALKSLGYDDYTVQKYLGKYSPAQAQWRDQQAQQSKIDSGRLQPGIIDRLLGK